MAAHTDRSPADAGDGIHVRIFSSASEAPRSRRPTDVVLLVLGGAILAVSALTSAAVADPEASAASFVRSLPLVLAGLWAVAYDLPVLWAVVLVVVVLVARGRSGLLRDQALAVVIAGGGAAISHRVVEGAWPAIGLLFADGPPSAYPCGRLAVASAVVVTSAPHLSRPLRYVGRWILILGALGAVFTETATPGGTLGAVVIGSMAAATVHLWFGSPGGRPSLTEVTGALRDLGVEASALRSAELQAAGVWTVIGVDADGQPIVVKVHGRDAWDSQLVTSTWRFLWYRHTSSQLRLSRERQVEHEALLLLLARDAGIGVPKVLAAGRARNGDALLVLEPAADPESTGDLGAMWATLGRAHAAGLSPCVIEATDLGWTPAGEGVLRGWADGMTAPDEAQRLQDRAQLLIASMLIVDRDIAVDAAIAALGRDATAALVPYLQSSTVSPAMRRRIDHIDESIEELRTEVAARLEVEQIDLVQLRRISLSTVVQAVLLILVCVAMVSGLSGLDFASVRDEVANLAAGGVIGCLVLSQLAHGSGAISTHGASPAPLPFGPVLELQFALAYINMAVPSTVGRLATMVRFFQRVGASAATALGVGAVDSAANLLVQIGLTVITLAFGLGTLDLQLTGHLGDLDVDASRLVLWMTLGLVAAVVVVLAVPRFRRKVLPVVSQVREGLRVLRSPAKVAMVIGGNVLTQLLYGLALAAAASATGADVGIADAVLINNVVSLFAGFLPVPGGIGVSEAGLTAGLVATGMSESAALCAALVHRVMSTYLPPVWGWFALQSLRRQRYL